MEQVKKRTKKVSDIQPIERLSLRKEEQEKLEAWVQELNLKFEGMIRLTKSDLANFLIRHHPVQLSEDEILHIETEHFDEVRWLNWAVNKVREAKKQGVPLTLQQLLDTRLKRNQAKNSPRKRILRKASGDNAKSTEQTKSLEIPAKE